MPPKPARYILFDCIVPIVHAKIFLSYRIEGSLMEIPFLLAEAIFTFFWLAVRLAVCIRKKGIDWKREAALLLMYINLAVILRFTFFPMLRVNGRVQPLVFDAASAIPFQINWIPFVNLFDYDSNAALLLNVIGNIAMFLPSGIILPFLYKQLNSLGKVFLAGAGLSLCIELLQLPFAMRTSDIDDLILNTLGVIIGYGIYLTAQKRKTAKA